MTPAEKPEGGQLHYWLYQQDGSKQPMNCEDTPGNRRFVEWTRVHDRYTPAQTGETS